MLSYCAKAPTAKKICTTPREVLAGIMRISPRAVLDSIHRLEKLGLVKVTRSKKNPRLPCYIVNDKPSASLCPDGLRGNKWSSALEYIADAGGVKNLQRRRAKNPRKKDPKRVGAPESQKDENTPELQDAPADDSTDDPADDSGPQPIENTGSTEQLGGITLPSQEEVHFPEDPSPEEVHFPNEEVHFLEEEVHFPEGGSTLHPVRDVQIKSLLRRPNGLSHQGDCRPLVPLHSCAQTAVIETEQPRVIGVPISDIKNNPEEDEVPETPEQIAAREAQTKAKKVGSHDAKIGVPGSGSGYDPDPAETKRPRGAGRPPRRSFGPQGQRSTGEVVDDMTPDPKTVSEVSGGPWGLCSHFRKVMRGKYPDAELISPDGRYLKWAKLLLKEHTTKQLYEMIQLLVLDYENFKSARIFLKYGGSPYPSFEQLYSNASSLVSYIGVGVVKLPSVRISPYAEDYKRRHEKADDGKTDDNKPVDNKPVDSCQSEISGEQPVDCPEAQALRDYYRKHG
jgi:hypothetical protein